MSIIDSIINFVSVTPDSFMPLKHTSTLNLILWTALSLFIYEQLTIEMFQSILENLSKYITIPFVSYITGTLTESIHIVFRQSGFPFKFAELIKPFSLVLYGTVYIIIIIYALSKAFLNTIIEHFTGKTLNI